MPARRPGRAAISTAAATNTHSSTKSAVPRCARAGLSSRPSLRMSRGWVLARKGAKTPATISIPIHTAPIRAPRRTNVAPSTRAA